MSNYEKIENVQFKVLFNDFNDFETKIYKKMEDTIYYGQILPQWLDDGSMYYKRVSIYHMLKNKYSEFWTTQGEEKTLDLLVNAFSTLLPALYANTLVLAYDNIAKLSPDNLFNEIQTLENEDADNRYRSSEMSYAQVPNSDMTTGTFTQREVSDKNITLTKDNTKQLRKKLDIFRIGKIDTLKLQGHIINFINSIEINSLFALSPNSENEYKIIQGVASEEFRIFVDETLAKFGEIDVKLQSHDGELQNVRSIIDLINNELVGVETKLEELRNDVNVANITASTALAKANANTTRIENNYNLLTGILENVKGKKHIYNLPLTFTTQGSLSISIMNDIFLDEVANTKGFIKVVDKNNGRVEYISIKLDGTTTENKFFTDTYIETTTTLTLDTNNNIVDVWLSLSNIAPNERDNKEIEFVFIGNAQVGGDIDIDFVLSEISSINQNLSNANNIITSQDIKINILINDLNLLKNKVQNIDNQYIYSTKTETSNVRFPAVNGTRTYYRLVLPTDWEFVRIINVEVAGIGGLSKPNLVNNANIIGSNTDTLFSRSDTTGSSAYTSTAWGVEYSNGYFYLFNYHSGLTNMPNCNALITYQIRRKIGAYS